MAKASLAEKSKNGGKTPPRAAHEVSVVEVDMPDLSPRIAHDEIERRAYGRFLQRGGQHGDDWADWFQAEAELRAEHHRAEAAAVSGKLGAAGSEAPAQAALNAG